MKKFKEKLGSSVGVMLIFPKTGTVHFRSQQADDNLIIKIDGVEIGKSKVFEGRKKINFNTTKGKENYRTRTIKYSYILILDFKKIQL
jgi:hypothetical protein